MSTASSDDVKLTKMTVRDIGVSELALYKLLKNKNGTRPGPITVDINLEHLRTIEDRSIRIGDTVSVTVRRNAKNQGKCAMRLIAIEKE